MKYKLKQNFIAGLLVSFIALPLCIAISGASEFPLLAGVITAIIGGIIVSQINSSQIAITGPAAGMIVASRWVADAAGRDEGAAPPSVNSGSR